MDARALLPWAASSPPEALGAGRQWIPVRLRGRAAMRGLARQKLYAVFSRPLRPCRRTIRRPLRGSRVGEGIEGPPEGDKQRQRPIAGLETLMSCRH